MQIVNKEIAPFEQRAVLFKKAVERAAKRYMVTLDCGYLQSYHDEHVVITDKADGYNEVYYNTLTREE